MGPIPKKDLPKFVRNCYEASRKSSEDNRRAEKERLEFYIGEQWRDEEKSKRRSQGRPFLTINKCKPAVDQIEGDIRLNPPGPQCHPVGSGADGDTADIIEGLIRECEYRSGAKTAYSTAGKYAAASGYGVLELATEFASDRDFSQQLVIQSVEDPNCVFFDATSRMANRQDAGHAGKIKMYSKVDYMATFGNKRKVLEKRGLGNAIGWMQDAIGTPGEMAQINEWTGTGNGPFYVCEFYMVEIDPIKLQMYRSASGAEIAFFEDEKIPKGFRPLEDPDDKNRYTRMVPRRKIKKYVVDALEVLDETEWLGTLIPLFPVLGPEVYIDGKLHRLSLIAGAIDGQRGLNYAATTAAETMGQMSRAPWIGPKGTFDDPRWKDSNTEMYSYLEYVPVFVTDETTGAPQLAPPPTKNLFEAAIQWMIGLGSWFSDHIKATTNIYDPSLGQQKGDQSGKAIEQLRSESNVGNFSYSDNLHRAVEVMYGEMCCIFPKILDGQRVVTIVKPDTQHEMVEINRDFGQDGIDPQTGKKGKANNICIGEYSVRVTVGPSYETRNEQAIAQFTEFMKIDPQIVQAPGVAGKALRWIGQGNPQIEAIADILDPKPGSDVTPQQMQQQMQQLQQQNQQIMQAAQRLANELKSKLPEIEYKKWSDMLKAATQIRVAEISASKDLDNAAGEREAALLESLLGMSHEAAMQATDHEHEQGMQSQQQEHEAASQVSDQAAQAQQAEQANQGEGND